MTGSTDPYDGYGDTGDQPPVDPYAQPPQADYPYGGYPQQYQGGYPPEGAGRPYPPAPGAADYPYAQGGYPPGQQPPPAQQQPQQPPQQPGGPYPGQVPGQGHGQGWPGGAPAGYQDGGYQNGGYDTGGYPVVDPYAGSGGYGGPGAQQPPYPQQPPAQQGYSTGQFAMPGQAPQVPQGAQATGVGPPPPRTPAEDPSAPRGKANYDTGEFAFVEDEEESSEDVIDWLKFTETRGERRDERRRSVRRRGIAVLVLLVLVVAGGAGYLFASGRMKFGSSSGGGSLPAAQRQVISVYLRSLNGKTSTALMVDDPTTHRAGALLIPDTLKVPQDGGSPMALGGSWDQQSASGTRDGLNSVLGTHVTGTWRLDAPFLDTLVDVLGGITVDADTAISQGGKQLVHQGSQTMNGAAAEAYATYQAKGEPAGAQLARFGQVMSAVVKAFPTDAISASSDVGRMGAVLDPSLPQKDLAAALAAMATDTGRSGFRTVSLPVTAGGAVASGGDALVKSVIGGAGQRATGGTLAQVAVQNGSGNSRNTGLADAALQNAGFSLASGDATTAAARATTQVLYSDAARQTAAQQVAQALGLGTAAVAKGTVPGNADVLVVLGKDYQG
ncbi:LCP family protein [Phaeacidiphilus oryzae]|uniref:LCP family protein n=1 Tax=Phaeacidiphilus oryzae TaxID=348818 RepID=UPI000565568F|nr:LCP family protein [Phaeacidiphilus oryzae]